jgi:hypothetical protein
MCRAFVIAAGMSCCALSVGAWAQEVPATSRVLTIRVIDSATRAPVIGAEVSVARAHQSDQTAQTGLVRVAVLDAGDTLRIRRLGYQPIVIPTIRLAADKQLITVGLVPIPRELSDVTIEGRMSAILDDIGFFERRKKFNGFFVDPNEMLYRHPTRTSDIFERAPGAKLSNAISGGRKLRFTRADDCTPNVYVDGVLVMNEPTIQRKTGTSRTGITRANEAAAEIFAETDRGIDEVGIREIAAVEAYATGAQAPPPYNGTGSSCGVVLFWSWNNLRRKPSG